MIQTDSSRSQSTWLKGTRGFAYVFTPGRKEVVEKNHVGRHVEGALPFRFPSNGNAQTKILKLSM
jgi:hypothetical protein